MEGKARKVYRDYRVLLAFKVPQVHKDLRANREKMGIKDLVGLQVQPETEVRMERLVRKVNQAHLDNLASVDLQEKKDHKDSRER